MGENETEPCGGGFSVVKNEAESVWGRVADAPCGRAGGQNRPGAPREELDQWSELDRTHLVDEQVVRTVRGRLVEN